jgi:hypothetical protein
MLRKRKGLMSSSEEVDPMAYTVNMVDCMLVLAVGFMLFAIMSMNMQSVIFGDMSQEQRQEVARIIKETVQVEQGQEINQPIENIKSGSGDQYAEVGTVYKDPDTGKLLMIPN